ncbi:ABC transporter permease [Roseibium sp.]|uniref:ABC transporter permease n=1 Tax=Roseibium sp. TaxID=1936156 RepID=UPI003A968EE0
MNRKLSTGLLLLPSAALIGIFAIGLLALVKASVVIDGTFDLKHYRDFLERQDYLDMLARTLLIAGLTTFFSLLIGFPTAYFIARNRANRNFLLMLVIFPWLVSIVVRSYGWMVILGPRGMVNWLLSAIGLTDAPVKLMYNLFGVVLGLTHVLAPFMIIAILSVLMQVPRTLEEAAASLGSKPLHSFRNVILPLAMPGILTGVTLVYLMATGAIVTPLMLGSLQNTMLGTKIFEEVMHFFDYPKAAALATVLLITALAVVLPLQWLERRINHRHGEGVSR